MKCPNPACGVETPKEELFTVTFPSRMEGEPLRMSRVFMEKFLLEEVPRIESRVLVGCPACGTVFLAAVR